MLPWAMPAYVSILLWRVGIFNTEFGLLNQWLTALGLPKYSILDNTVTAFLACLALNLWMALPFMIATIDGALQSVDASLYESATPVSYTHLFLDCCRIKLEWPSPVEIIKLMFIMSII